MPSFNSTFSRSAPGNDYDPQGYAQQDDSNEEDLNLLGMHVAGATDDDDEDDEDDDDEDKDKPVVPVVDVDAVEEEEAVDERVALERWEKELKMEELEGMSDDVEE